MTAHHRIGDSGFGFNRLLIAMSTALLRPSHCQRLFSRDVHAVCLFGVLLRQANNLIVRGCPQHNAARTVNDLRHRDLLLWPL
jgi:hypothetical protein